MRKIYLETLRENLLDAMKNMAQSTWPLPADLFVEWLVKYPSQSSKTLELFRDWLEGSNWIVKEAEEEGKEVWWDSYAYLPNEFVDFAQDWVDESERRSYYLYCLKFLKERLNLTYEEMAGRIGVSYRSLFRWLKEESSKPSQMAIRLIEDYLNQVRLP